MEWPIITKDTSIEEIHRIHKAIWQYVMDNGEKPDTPYMRDCVLCEYKKKSHLSCNNCLAKWSNKRCNAIGSEYHKYLLSMSREDSNLKDVIEKIRDIPFKYEEEKKDGYSK